MRMHLSASSHGQQRENHTSTHTCISHTHALHCAPCTHTTRQDDPRAALARAFCLSRHWQSRDCPRCSCAGSRAPSRSRARKTNVVACESRAAEAAALRNGSSIPRGSDGKEAVVPSNQGGVSLTSVVRSRRWSSKRQCESVVCQLLLRLVAPLEAIGSSCSSRCCCSLTRLLWCGWCLLIRTVRRRMRRERHKDACSDARLDCGLPCATARRLSRACLRVLTDWLTDTHRCIGTGLRCCCCCCC